MSLLMEALKKADQQRSVPSHQPPQAELLLSRPHVAAAQQYYSAQPIQMQTQTHFHWVFYAGFINILIVALVFFFWTQYQQQSQQNFITLSKIINARPVSQSPLALGNFGIAPAAKPAIPPQHIAAQSAPTPTPSPSPSPSPTQHAVSLAPVLQQKIVKPAAIVPIDVDKIYHISELPREIRQSFPKLEYNAHLYSESVPDARMIIANNKQYGENDSIGTDITIESIQHDGVIYKYKGFKVYVAVAAKINGNQ